MHTHPPLHSRWLVLQLMSAEKERVDAEAAAKLAREEFRSYRVEITRLKVRSVCVCACVFY